MTTLIIASTEGELTLLVEDLKCRQKSRLLDFTVYQPEGPADNGPVILRCGAGIANAAAAAALGITLYSPAHIFNVGVCGVYNAGLDAIGQVVTGSRAIFADTGVDSCTGFQSMRAIDLPLAQPAPDNQVFNTVHLQDTCSSRMLKRGVFLTVSACSGSMQRAAIVSKRFKCDIQETLCEDMESAAVGLIACKAGIPCTVLRAISNVCGDRDYGNWKLSEAAQAAQTELLKYLKS